MERLKKRGHDECGRLGAREGFVRRRRWRVSGQVKVRRTAVEMEEGGRFGWRRR